jgi:nitroreductase
MDYPRKPAPTDLPIVEALRERWSPYAFSDRPVEDDKIQTLFEAARWAPSSFNEQPWRYVYATKTDGEARERLESLLLPGNAWAKNAFLLAVSFAKKTFTYNGKENRHALHDTGAASAYLAAQCPSLGLVAHQMAGFKVDEAASVLGVPADFVPGSMIAVGYPGNPRDLDPKLQERENAPRERKSQKEFVFQGRKDEYFMRKY